jgi:hypothetical protein
VKLGSAVIAVLLAGCASHEAGLARTALIGASYIDAKTCLGFPTRAETIEDGSLLAQWDYIETGDTAALPLSDLAALPITLPFAIAGTVSINGSGNCHAIAHVVAGKITSFVYSGAAGVLSGPDARCHAIVRGCPRSLDAG